MLSKDRWMKQEKSLNDKNLAKTQLQLIRVFSDIGDVLVYETRRKRNNSLVESILRQLQDLFTDFVKIQYSDPIYFKHLLLSQEFFEIYKISKQNAALELEY